MVICQTYTSPTFVNIFQFYIQGQERPYETYTLWSA